MKYIKFIQDHNTGEIVFESKPSTLAELKKLSVPARKAGQTLSTIGEQDFEKIAQWGHIPKKKAAKKKAKKKTAE